MPTPPQGPSGGSDAQPQFVFTFSAVSANNDPYYVVDWNKAVPVEVVAASREEGMRKAETALGSAGNYRHWRYRLRSVRDALVPVEESSS